VGGFGVVFSAWAYGLGHPGPPDGPLVPFLPNLSARQFVYAAIAIPGELFFAIGLNALLGRRRVVDYSVVRVLRRFVLLVTIVATAAIARQPEAAPRESGRPGPVRPRDPPLRPARRTVAPVGDRRGAALRDLGVSWRGRQRLQFRADTFLVNGILGVRATGVYWSRAASPRPWYVPERLGVACLAGLSTRRDAAGRRRAHADTTAGAALAIPTFFLGPRLVQLVYGRAFADAGVALRLILPGIVAYSVVAILSRYIVGQGRPGLGTVIFSIGLAVRFAMK
jgi:hypothetical protein